MDVDATGSLKLFNTRSAACTFFRLLLALELYFAAYDFAFVFLHRQFEVKDHLRNLRLDSQLSLPVSYSSTHLEFTHPRQAKRSKGSKLFPTHQTNTAGIFVLASQALIAFRVPSAKEFLYGNAIDNESVQL